LRRVIFAIVTTASALVFLLSFKTHSTPVAATSPPSASASAAPAASASAAATSKAASGTSSSSSSSSASSSANTAATTVTGDEAQTIYGPVVVKITVKNGKVTAAEAIEYPNSDPRDAQINSYAIPALNSEAVGASSARIDTISGATYTSQGYLSSLQSALDKAGL
jgi:uncharacterized protein with FMN-binding domain